MSFEPFDEEYKFDKSILTESFPPYLLPSVRKWIFGVLKSHGMAQGAIERGYFFDNFLFPLNRQLRKSLPPNESDFFNNIFSSKKVSRNVLSYILQRIAYENEGRELEQILSEASSAYSVEFTESNAPIIQVAGGKSKLSQKKMKLVYRVAPVVKKQAAEILNNNDLIAEAWESHYGMKPDDEKTVTRCTDALAGLLRDKYFPTEKRPQLGTLLQKMRAKPTTYPLPADSLYDNDKFLEIMKDFSKIRGNHKTGTGRAPTHEEAGFVLHYTIMLFQLLRNK